MKDYILSKEYMYKVAKNAILPLLKKYVESTENDLDDAVYVGVERLVEALLKPKEKAS